MQRKEGISQFFEERREGDKAALDELTALAYEELRRRAASCLSHEGPEHILSPCALVHEAYLRLAEQKTQWQNPAHLCAMATSMMRRILSNHARDRSCAKRGGGALHLPLDEATIWTEERMAALDDALLSLSWESPGHAKIVELFYFRGLNRSEIAQLIGVSVPTVGRRLRMARSWLHRHLSQQEGAPQSH